jgi:Rieske Fe-S protein
VPTPDLTATRRQVTKACIGALGAGCLVACSGSSATDAAPTPESKAKGKPLSALSDIPVGGAVSVNGPDGTPMILAQPTPGEVVAFSGVCTHAGCTVAPAGELVLTCPCHGSTFDAATGKSLTGPASAALPRVPVTVKGETIVVD